MIFHTRFWKHWNFCYVKLHFKGISFSTDNGLNIKMRTCFYRISNHKNFFPKYLNNSLIDFAWTSRTSSRLLEEKAPVNDFGRTVPSAEKYGCKWNVISLLWQLRYHCNPIHNKFSSQSNATVVVVFPNLCQWRRSLCSNLGGVDPEKPYRANLNNTNISVQFFLWTSCGISLQ